MGTVVLYVAVIVAANLLVAWLGPWFAPVIALLLIGLDLSLRDSLHERWRGKGLWPRLLGMIVAASVVSYALNPSTGRIALASLIAFTVAALADTAVYQLLIRRGWYVKANGSNIAGALADSLLFPTIAFGGFMPAVVGLQFVAKVAGGAGWAWVIRKTRG